MGLVPDGTELAPRNPGVEAWEDLSDNERALAARLQEAFAAFLDHTDAQVGRFLDALDRLGELDNTIIVFLSDNGASQEGGRFGSLHEMKYFNLMEEDADAAIDRLDDIGGPHSHTNYPWGWAQAGNTPFKWYKQNTHEGGVHVPMIVRWPAGISARGEVRHQFHHVNDIVPTIYEAVGVTPPDTYRGFEQMPVTGSPMNYTFDAADVPSTKKVQYFEMGGHRAIYADGWKAVTRHQPGTPFDDDVWELYHLAEDRSECHDLAAAEPARLQELIDLWWAEAETHGVFPLDDRTVELFGARFRHGSAHRPDRHYTYYPPMSPMPGQVGPGLGGLGWDLLATMDRPAGAGGVIYAIGTENSGMTVYVQDDRLVFDYNAFGDHSIATSDRPVPEGETVVGVEFRRTGGGATATLVIDGAPAGSVDVPFVMFMMSSIGPSVGLDHGSAVSSAYRAPFRFEGDLQRVDVQLYRSFDEVVERDEAEARRRAELAQQ
jgi:arylsulfatase